MAVSVFISDAYCRAMRARSGIGGGGSGANRSDDRPPTLPDNRKRRLLPVDLGYAIAGASSGCQASEQGKVIGDHRRPDVSLEMLKPAPSATGEPVGALQAGYARLDAGAEVAELAVDPTALHHIFDAKAALLVEGHVADATGLRLIEIGLARIAAIGGCLPRRLSVKGDVPLQHRQQPVAIGWIAGLDRNVEDQAASACDKVELVAVTGIATAFDDDIGVRLEQADEFLGGRNLLALQHPPLALCNDALNQRPGMLDLARQSTLAAPPALPAAPPLGGDRLLLRARLRSTRDRIEPVWAARE